MPLKIYVFLFFHLSARPAIPVGKGMINVQRQNRMPLASWQRGTDDIVAPNASHLGRSVPRQPLLVWSHDVKGCLLELPPSNHFSNSSPPQKRGRRQCWHVWTLGYSTVLHYTSYCPKRVNICLRSLRCVLWYHSYPQLGNQWKCVCRRAPQRLSTSVQISSVLSPLFFSQLSQMRSEGKKKCATFPAPTLSRTFTLK